jgi:hypothetical protein
MVVIDMYERGVLYRYRYGTVVEIIRASTNPRGPSRLWDQNAARKQVCTMWQANLILCVRRTRLGKQRLLVLAKSISHSASLSLTASLSRK